MSGIAVGLKKGHIVTKRTESQRPARRKGGLGERTKFVRGVVREVVGWAPYEKRIMEILKGGGNNPGKRAWKFAKRRVSIHAHTHTHTCKQQQEQTIAAAIVD